VKITIAEIIDRNNIIGRMILNSASAASPDFTDSFVGEGQAKSGEVLMTVNGYDIDISVFANHLQASLDEMIKAEAEKLLTDKCEDMKNTIYDLAEKISEMAERAIRGV
jgi:hypothetical protein